jgi:hypothetical protein
MPASKLAREEYASDKGGGPKMLLSLYKPKNMHRPPREPWIFQHFLLHTCP